MPRTRKSKIDCKMTIIDASIELTEMLGLSGKDFKAVVVKILQQAIINMLETNENRESFSKEIEVIKKNQMAILQLKNIITENKNFKG